MVKYGGPAGLDMRCSPSGLTRSLLRLLTLVTHNYYWGVGGSHDFFYTISYHDFGHIPAKANILVICDNVSEGGIKCILCTLQTHPPTQP